MRSCLLCMYQEQQRLQKVYRLWLTGPLKQWQHTSHSSLTCHVLHWGLRLVSLGRKQTQRPLWPNHGPW